MLLCLQCFIIEDVFFSLGAGFIFQVMIDFLSPNGVGISQRGFFFFPFWFIIYGEVGEKKYMHTYTHTHAHTH